MPLRREVVVLVAAGAVLGIVHNSIGLASHPPRGIPWIAVKAQLPSLESLTPPDSAAATPGPAEAPGTTSPPAPGPTSAAPPTPSGGEPRRDPGAASAPRTPGGATSVPPGASSKAPPGAGEHSTPSSGGGVPEPRRAGPLPFIPESDQPIQMQMPTVRRFFDAKAALFLDARDPAEYEKGHIPGAIRLTNPEAQNEPERLKSLPVAGRPTIVYCEGGACEASLDLARFLLDSGFKKVLVYMGGFPEWEAAGNPVTRGSTP
jgi:rhodanese-related sulfurtransferase